MQCHFQFHNHPAGFCNNVQKINFALSYLYGQAFQWFKPGFSRQLYDLPAWLDDWEEFIKELEVNFGPYCNNLAL
jgi:hypothetical protein